MFPLLNWLALKQTPGRCLSGAALHSPVCSKQSCLQPTALEMNEVCGPGVRSSSWACAFRCSRPAGVLSISLVTLSEIETGLFIHLLI